MYIEVWRISTGVPSKASSRELPETLNPHSNSQTRVLILMVNHYLAIAFVAIGLAHQDARAWGSLFSQRTCSVFTEVAK